MLVVASVLAVVVVASVLVVVVVSVLVVVVVSVLVVVVVVALEDLTERTKQKLIHCEFFLKQRSYTVMK